MSTVADEPVVAPPPVALDRVMLAMDVVDTLRHEHELVERELDDDRRQRELVERVQRIYDAQGIEVPEAIIAEGVRALRENRFVYRPPERTLEVRLAEAYVDRGRWAVRLAVAFGIVLAIWAAFAVPAHYRWRALVESFEGQVARVVAMHARLEDQVELLRTQWSAASEAETTPAGRRLLEDAENELLAAEAAVDALGVGLGRLPDPEAYPEDIGRWNGLVQQLDDRIAAAGAAAGTANGLLGAVRQLDTLRVRLASELARLDEVVLTTGERAAVGELRHRIDGAIDAGDAALGQAALVALREWIDELLVGRRQRAALEARFAGLATRLDGVDVEAAAVAELAQRRGAVQQAIEAGDWARARQQLLPYADLVEELDRAYELRIVSRPGAQSGVWRYEVNNRRQRNYYVIVEAIGADGAPIALPITSEENQSTRVVERFGVRVPEAVFEQVKADKLDNGLIDNALFGTKRRGAREPQYLFPVSGGRITEW